MQRKAAMQRHKLYKQANNLETKDPDTILNITVIFEVRKQVDHNGDFSDLEDMGLSLKRSLFV